MPQKYQKLRKANYDAAVEIACILKERKAISEKEFGNIYAKSNGIRFRHGSFDTLMETTKKFLQDHGVVTFKQINGLNLWIATQKCVRTKIENMFIEYQYVTNAAIDKAIEWQTINDGMIDPKLEGQIIANKILGLTGDVASAYTRMYAEVKMYFEEMNQAYTPGYPCSIHMELKYAVLAPIRDMKAIKKQ